MCDVGVWLELGVGLELGNQVLTSRRGVIIWQVVKIRHNTGPSLWDNLAVSIRMASSLPSLKFLLQKHLFSLAFNQL